MLSQGGEALRESAGARGQVPATLQKRGFNTCGPPAVFPCATQLLEEQEREREAKLQAFYDAMARRANAAGAMAVRENQERAEREEEVLRQQWREAEERARRKEEDDRRRQAAVNEELARVRAEQIALKQRLAERQQQEMRNFMDTVRQHDESAVQAEIDQQR